MEYLMTYGWAILIIAVVLGALFQLGVFNSSSFSPRAPPGACQVFRPSGPGTTTNINLMGVCTGQLPQYVAQFNGASSDMTVYNLPVFISSTNRVTFSMWVNPKIADGWLARKTQSGVMDLGLRLISGNKPQFTAYNVGTPYYVTSANAIQNKIWTFITGTYDGSYLRMYINGVQDASLAATGNIADVVRLMTIGESGSTAYFNGSISNIQVYNTSLSANQVQALYLEGIGGAPMKLQNLVGWWPLNGNSNDYSSNNNNGVPTAVTFTSQYGK